MVFYKETIINDLIIELLSKNQALGWSCPGQIPIV